MARNNDGAGATQVKTGDQATPIDRFNAYDRTVGAAENKTKTQHPHIDKHYHYQPTEWDGSLNQASAYDGPKQPQGTY